MRFTRSIRWRLQLWLAFLLACILAGFGITAYQLQRMNRMNQIDDELSRRVDALAADMRQRPGGDDRPERRPPPDGGSRRPPPERDFLDGPPSRGPREDRPGSREFRLTPSTVSLFSDAEGMGFYFVVWSRMGREMKTSTNLPPGLAMPARPEESGARFTRSRGGFREAIYFNGLGECVLVGRSITADLVAVRRFGWWLVAAGGAVLALGLGGGWWLAGRAMRPVQDIGATAGRISAGNLSERINVAGTDNELGELAGVLNSTFARLESAFAQQRQFTADASHELRTPLAVLISEAQTTLARERTAAEYRETVEACLDTAQEMKRLTESLLELARFDGGKEPLARERVDLADAAGACVERLRPLAKSRGIRLHCDFATATTQADPVRIHQLMANLLANAIHYNVESGEIKISTRVENGSAILAVADTGVGISNEDLPRIFERFYRADKSRARANGRSGLGLAISKAIVDAHGGSICVESSPGKGSRFEVRLPRC